MEISEKVLKCMGLGADKKLAFGCIISATSQNKYRPKGHIQRIHWSEEPKQNPLVDYDIIGIPITYGRLYFLLIQNLDKKKISDHLWMDMLSRFIIDPKLCDQTILERTEELVDKVLLFLESLKTGE